MAIDFRPAMLDLARDRAVALGMSQAQGVVRAGQRRLERLSIRLAGDHQTRQPDPEVVAGGFTVDRLERLRVGIIERVRAFKPTDR